MSGSFQLSWFVALAIAIYLLTHAVSVLIHAYLDFTRESYVRRSISAQIPSAPAPEVPSTATK